MCLGMCVSVCVCVCVIIIIKSFIKRKGHEHKDKAFLAPGALHVYFYSFAEAKFTFINSDIKLSYTLLSPSIIPQFTSPGCPPVLDQWSVTMCRRINTKCDNSSYDSFLIASISLLARA